MVWGIVRRWPLAGRIGLLNDRKNYGSYSYEKQLKVKVEQERVI
jgi:hypothetical protein